MKDGGARQAIGSGVAFWQWHGAKVKSDRLVAFLRQLKASTLPGAAILQVEHMLTRLDPPKK